MRNVQVSKVHISHGAYSSKANPSLFLLSLRSLLVKCRSVVDWDHLVNEVSRIKHRNPHQPLDYELRLEQILAFLGQTL